MSNPFLTDAVVEKFAAADAPAKAGTMTVSGSIIKTALATAMVGLGGIFSWVYIADTSSAGLVMFGSSIAALVLGFIIIFKGANAALVLSYALLQGLAMGLISKAYEGQYAGIVQDAIIITFSTLVGMLALYQFKIVKVTEKLRSVILIATVGVFLFLLIEFLLALIAPGMIYSLESSGFGLVIAVGICVVAALNLLLDFDFIDKGVEQKLPAKTEWYAAFGLMVTLIWLYVSILRALGRSRS